MLAGVNGAGKSSVAGAFIRRAGGEYYNPDEATGLILRRNPRLALATANALAWAEGKERLERAIVEGSDFVFETTLGANTITHLLLGATREGMAVKVCFVGLASVEHHLRRVAARVAAGGHDIAESKIRERWHSSRLNIIRLLPHLTEFVLWDNSEDFALSDFAEATSSPVLLLHVVDRKIVGPDNLAATPEWAKPIVAAAYKHFGLLD